MTATVRHILRPIDLEAGVVPISKAAASLAMLIKRARADHQPIIVTQKGYPTGVLLDIGLFTALRKLAEEVVVADDAPPAPED